MTENQEKLPSRTIESTSKSREYQFGVLKGLIGAIPYIGTMVNEVLFETPNRIQQSRINNTVDILEDKLEKFNTNSIFMDYLKSDDFFDFTRSLFSATLKMKSEEKRKMLVNIYLNSIKEYADFELSRKRLFLNFITELSIIQIIILKYIEHNESKLEEIGTYSKFFELFISIQDKIELNNYEFKYYCNELENKGLISLGAGLDDFFSTSDLFATGGHKEPSVQITEFGKEFLEYLI